MKNKVINAATCDARGVTEDSLAGFDSITVNAAFLITDARARALMNQYPVTLNVATVLDVPEGRNITIKSINGKGEIGPDADGTDVFLLVNGRLTIADGSLDAVKSYYRIMVNGKLLMPASYQGQFPHITTNGKTEYYPDGAFILKGDTEVDDLFVLRAANTLYYCPGDLFFLDLGLHTEKLLEKGLRFAGQRIIIAESLLDKLVSRFSEEAEILRVPDGTKRVDDDLELTSKAVKRYGTKLFVSGDVSIHEGEALSSMEYLYVNGTVKIDKGLEDTFDELNCVYDELKVIDPDIGCLSDRPLLKVGPAVLKKYPSGVLIEDCAKVMISEDLAPEEIMDKLRISDCALVVCSKEQEEAVNMIAEDVAMVRVSGQEQEGLGGMVDDMLGGFFGKPKDTQVINAAEYKM